MQEEEEMPLETALTEEQEEVLWKSNLEELEAESPGPTSGEHHLSEDARVVLGILGREIDVEDVHRLIRAMREGANHLEHYWIHGPGRFLSAS